MRSRLRKAILISHSPRKGMDNPSGSRQGPTHGPRPTAQPIPVEITRLLVLILIAEAGPVDLLGAVNLR